MADFELEIDTKGIDDLLMRFPQNKRRFSNAMGEVLIGNMKESFNTSPPGQEYSRGQGRVHVASQPGYPPNIDYGDLTNSLRYELRGDDTVEIYGAEHGRYLEDSSELNRPFISPAVRRLQREQIVPLGKRWLFED